jgi:[protein-PII] uridylyltransferase
MQTLLPLEYSDSLAVSSPYISTQDICQLSRNFQQWQKDTFPNVEVSILVSARAQFVDNILNKLWCQHNLDEDQISLLAVGGYGRGELHPYSDVDILLLTQEDITSELSEKISAFITQLWDVKLDVGHSVRSIKECIKQAENDVTVATNLMEVRQICGNESLTQNLYPLLAADVFWTSKKFFIAKRDEQYERHQQYHGASYTLEPNLKANPGGLRDIQTIAWVAKRHFVADSFEELVAHNYLTQNEFFELLECQDYLWRMRAALHIIAGRSENRLLFDYQADVASLMGFGEEGKQAIERMMQRFFRILGRVAELNKMLLQHFEYAIIKKNKPLKEIPLTKDFIVVDGQIKTTNDRVFMRSVKIMEMFLLVAQNESITDLHPNTLRLLRNARRRLISGLMDYADCRKLFIEIMKHPNGLGLTFTLMHRHSIIAAYLPQWRNIVGQMQFDLFHAYSVDEHSYRLIKNLYRFSQTEHNADYPLCSKIMQRIRKPEVLYIAGIFHDIAKGRGGDHAKLGAVDALEFSKVHPINDHDGRMIAWLVKNHLLMSVTAQRRDISDHEVIKAFGEIVRDEAHLDYLYCLTVADMRATNESLWNSWKANLLEELYFNTKRAFLRGLEKQVDLRSKIRENQEKALELLEKSETNITEVKKFWSKLKADYFSRYSPVQIAWHSQHIIKHNIVKPLVLISPKPYRGGTEIFFYTKASPNIFAKIVSSLDAKRLSIHDAKIISSKKGYTLNTFVVLDKKNKAITDSHRTLDIAKALTKALMKPSPKFKSKAAPAYIENFKIPTRVSFIETSSEKSTLLEIIALDHPGLLSKFAKIFQQYKINIHSAKITTFGEKAEDVFTVSNVDNLALTQDQQQQLAAMLCDNSLNV